jgi:carbonic anhydrase
MMNKIKFLSTKMLLVLSMFTALISCEKMNKKTEVITVKTEKVSTPEATPESARPAHWSYTGSTGPDTWATLSPTYATCGEGHSQSPINILQTELKAGVNGNFKYVPSESFTIAHNNNMENIVDNGHTIQVTVDGGSVFTFGQKSYSLKQFHFHTPSEHTIDGKHMPMEMHMVHQSDDGSLAVVGILIKEGKIKKQKLREYHCPSSKFKRGNKRCQKFQNRFNRELSKNDCGLSLYRLFNNATLYRRCPMVCHA